MLLCGCQHLLYIGPTGERLSRFALGTQTTISGLELETSTNGVRRINLKGYQSDSTQAMGVVTEAAVKAALQVR
jgi:hypothetical protein